MDSRGKDNVDEIAATETPEDVAVLYSWANVHGAKYRDFSASRREYRAQLRLRAAEQVREQALLAQAEAEAASAAADAIVRQTTAAARVRQPEAGEASAESAMREAEEAARLAAAERVETARRAEAAAIAEATARREEREIAEAHASAQRQAARYAESEMRRQTMPNGQPEAAEAPGRMTDPYTSSSNAHPIPFVAAQLQRESPIPVKSAASASLNAEVSTQSVKIDLLAANDIVPLEAWRETCEERRAPAMPRRQGYRPNDAIGERQIYRGSHHDTAGTNYISTEPVSDEALPISSSATTAAPSSVLSERVKSDVAEHATGSTVSKPRLPRSVFSSNVEMPGHSSGERRTSAASTRSPVGPYANSFPTNPAYSPAPSNSRRSIPPFSQSLVPSDSARGRRPQDDLNYQSPTMNEQEGRTSPENPGGRTSGSRPGYVADPAGPAWLYAPPIPQSSQRQASPSSPPAQSSVADTLQHSRERVAARWFALKGVFEQPGQEQEIAPVRQKETRTPVLAVFSLAGGVGKTSLVATVGRSLSSMGEKVLLADTTSHGLLPFYFGASELRQGAVRTFSPPSGSTDAPIYLVSYDVDQRADEEAQEQLAEEIIGASLGTHRILLDLMVGSSWIVRRLSRMNPTILMPVAPDMNSVISLQTVEKFFGGINDGDGRPLQPYYVLNQFDASLPLHLDVREVMRRQLGERLLPFVIRRAPAVSEALAEGMTVVDYAPDAPVAEDYLNLATWLRTIAAPATAGFRNVRWSER